MVRRDWLNDLGLGEYENYTRVAIMGSYRVVYIAHLYTDDLYLSFKELFIWGVFYTMAHTGLG